MVESQQHHIPVRITVGVTLGERSGQVMEPPLPVQFHGHLQTKMEVPKCNKNTETFFLDLLK
jgi:hypothetical protein